MKNLDGNKIFLFRLSVDNLTEEYVSWSNSSSINQYLDSRFTVHIIENTKSFIKSVTNDNNYIFGIFLKSNNRHCRGCRNLKYKS